MAEHPATPANEPPAPPGRADRQSHRLRMLLQALLSITVVAVVLFVIIPQHVDIQEVKSALAGITGPEMALLGVITVFYAVSGTPFIAAATPRLGFGRAFLTAQTTTAVSRLVPGGGAAAPAIRYRYWHGWGLSSELIAISLISIGVFTVVTWLCLPVVSVIAASAAGEGSWWLAVVAVLAAAVLALACAVGWWAIRSARAASAIGGAIGAGVTRLRHGDKQEQKALWEARVLDLRTQLLEGLGQRAWGVGAGAALYVLAGFVVLLGSLRIVGVGNDTIGWEWVLVGFAVGNILGAIPITPAGLGIADLGMAAVLSVGQTEATQALIVAALVVYRAVTFIVPIPTGGVSYLVARRSLTRAAQAHSECDAASKPGDAERVTTAG